jgi:hypothetical protein
VIPRHHAAAIDDALLTVVQEAARTGRPVRYTGATVRTLDPDVGDVDDTDLVVLGTSVLGADPAPDDSVVVDCAGLSLVPVADATLTAGNPATFAVVPSGRGQPLERLVWYEDQAAAMLVDGRVTRWAGRRVARHAPGPHPVDSPYVGTWVESDVEQHLRPDGRYDETRASRPHAYQGAYWIVGDQIVYHDDLGFWAYGRFVDGVLHHAHFVFRRR